MAHVSQGRSSPGHHPPGGQRFSQPQGRTTRDDGGHDGEDMRKLLEGVRLSQPTPDLFDQKAEQIARLLDRFRDGNRSSQLRMFYDQILRHCDKHRGAGTDAAARFAADLPFIRMLSARAAYARTRKTVDANFVVFLQTLIRQVESPQHLEMLRTLFEAVIGFLPKK